MSECAVRDCHEKIKARVWCSRHLQRFYRTGDPYGVRKTVVLGTLSDRLWLRVNKHPTCWLFEGSQSAAGYGQVGDGGRVFYAHRLAWEMMRGPIPDGMQVDHLCRTRNCVNPDHLELVTPLVNVQRAEAVRDAI